MITNTLKIFKNIYDTLYQDYTFYIFLFFFIHFLSENIDKTFESLYFDSQITLYVTSCVYYYMDNNVGWWMNYKIIPRSKENKYKISYNKLITINFINSLLGYIINKKILLNISSNRGLIYNNENLFIVLRDFLAIFYLYDFFFYINHRLIHTPLLYKKIHKLHHSIYANCAFSANYMTCTDYLLEIIFPFWLALYIYNPCFMSSYIFAIIGQLNGAITHSGYNLKYFGNPIKHRGHHLYFNKNYGIGGPCDYLFKTYI